MRYVPITVQRGAPIAAQTINDISQGASSAILHPGMGDGTAPTPFGTAGALRRRPAPEPWLPPALAPDLPWEPRLRRDDASDEWQLHISHWGYIRGPITRLGTEDLIYTLPTPPPAGVGDYYVGVRLDTITGEVDDTLLISQDVADVTSTTPPDDHYFRRLLYVLRASQRADVYRWQIVATWPRLLPDLGAYL